MWTENLVRKYEERGYVVDDDADEPDTLETLLAATRQVKVRIRASEVDVYTDTRGECPWELALVDDDFLELVSGTHLRYQTEREHDIYRPDAERLSMVSAFIVHKEEDVTAKRDIGRFSNILSPGVHESLPESLHLYYDRWRAVHE